MFVQAQTSVTFNIDMKQMMQDSTFIPGQHVIQVNGNLFPFGPNRPVRMRDEQPKDSVFTAEVSFSRRFNEERLRFNFEIVKPVETIKERGPRSIVLNGQDITLPPAVFNSFIQ